MNLYWPILLAVGSNVVYQICAKSSPRDLDPFASLCITYLVGAAASCAMYFLTHRDMGDLMREYTHLSWTPFVLGLAVVGLEVGILYIYRVGWSLNTGYVVQSILLSILLIFVGFFLYHEAITWTKLAGMAFCTVGIFFINR